ncbi:MAG TPA: glycosyltransferase family 1 protein [Planctomycetota bacterium]|jgi:alpha-1,3-rhamnosyl/mannosyltransferase|nr:glycosyltransferase family 1 protein [Planctomycetota bacterium]
MRVGLDYRPALLQRTGIGRYVRELVAALGAVEGRPDLALFGDSFARVRVPEPAAPGARLYRRRIPGRLLPLLARLGLGADDLVGGVDLFHYTDFVYPPVRRAPFVATIFDASFAVDDSFHGPRQSAILRARAEGIVHGARVVLAPSTFAAAEIVLRLGAHPSRVFVTPLGVDHRRSSPAPPGASAPPFLLTVGTLEPRKNHRLALDAFERLRAKGFPHRWVVVGRKGWLFEPFLERLARSPVRDDVELRGEVGEEELEALYAGASLLLYPSLYEGFGLPPLEAMARGLPVVASAVAALPEVCADDALLVDPRDPSAIAEAASRVLEDAALRRSLVEGGLSRARAFTWEACARGTVAAYARAVEAPGPRPLARLF